MYNDDYFKKILGNDYKEDELYTPTYLPDYKKYREVTNYTSNVIKEATDVNKDEEIKTKKVNNKLEDNTKVIKKVKEIAKDIGEDISQFYPDIYNIAMPVIESVISKNTELSITKDVIDTMTTEVYNIIEDEGEEKESTSATMQVSARPMRRPKNKNLCDLIQILLIDYLRPHHRPMPPKPPMPMPPLHHPFPEDLKL